MKKLLSVSLILCMLLTLGVTLASCAHTCEFSSEWSDDSKSHWHACEKKDCEEVEDKEDHKWDEGQITSVATQEEDGVKTFTCTVCERKKKEVVEFTGLSKEEWDAVFADELFLNFQYEEVVEGESVSTDSEVIYKFMPNKAYVKQTVGFNGQEEYITNSLIANETRRKLVDILKSMTAYDRYEYDAETKTYKSKGPINVSNAKMSISEATVTITDGRLTEIQYAATQTHNNTYIKITSTITLSNYGTVTLPSSEE